MTTRVVNVRAETYDVYIGRKKGGSVYDTGDWGNPCVIGKDGTRDEVIEKISSSSQGTSSIRTADMEATQEVVWKESWLLLQS